MKEIRRGMKRQNERDKERDEKMNERDKDRDEKTELKR